MICRCLKMVAVSLAGLTLLVTHSAQAQVTDLSESKIEIRYSFEGAELILFGTTGNLKLDGDYDVVVVVRGPTLPSIVREKAKKYGIWMNDDAVTFPTAPGYYAVATSRPLTTITTRAELNAFGIGFDNLTLSHQASTDLSEKEIQAFRKALYRGKAKNQLYREGQDPITLIGQGLFRTNIYLPSNVPVGDFQVNAYIIQDGSVVGGNSIPMLVSKEGFERAVYDFANLYPFLYGLTAVLIALFAGWMAGVIGQRKG